jgi:HEAT repeat protein
MTRLAGWLGVRSGEGRLVGLVATTFATIEAGRGFGEIGAATLFVSRFGAANLPYLFVALGAISLIVALGYGAAVGRFRRVALFIGLLGAIAAILAVERLALLAGDAPIPAVWLTVFGAGALVVTLLWTLAGTVFDARQAKRLFPILTSAAIAGSFAGTLAAGPLARVLGAESLVLIEAVLLGAGAVLVSRVAATGGGSRLASRPGSRTSMAADLRAGFDHVVRSPLMRLVAIAYLLFSILDFSVSFPFLAAMDEAFPGEADLATALGLLSAGVTLASLVVALAIANRLFARIGVAGAALVLPIVYVGGFGLWIASFSIATAALLRTVQQVTQRGLSNAAWSAFYNVLPADRRAQVLAFNDGVPGQVGIALSGVLLLAASRFLQPAHVFWLGLATAVALALVVVAIRRRYADSLVRTLRSGLAEQVLEGGPGLAALARDGRVSDELLAGLASPEPSVRRIAAMLLGRIGARSATAALAERLDDEDAGVRMAALEAMAGLGTAADGAEADGIASRRIAARLADQNASVRVAAIRAASILAADALREAAGRLVGDPSPEVRAALAVALVRGGEEERPHDLLRALLESPAAVDRIRGLEAVGELGGHAPSAGMPDLLADPNAEVRAAAVMAVAATDDGRNGTTDALVAALGDEALVVRRAASAVLRERPEPPPGVLERLETGSGDEQEAALAALEGHGPTVRPRLLRWAETQVSRAATLRREHAALGVAGQPPADRSAAFLAFLTDRRREQIELRLLHALSVLGAPEASGLIRRCLRSPEPETRAQAIEALDSIGDRRLGGAVASLLDEQPDRNPDTRDAVLRRLSDDPDPWIRALALRARADALADDWVAIRDRASTDPDDLVRSALGRADQGGPLRMPQSADDLGAIDRMLFLRRVPLFEGLAPEDLQRIAATATERVYAPGEVLVREGDVGDELVVILEGSVRVVRHEDGEERLVRRYAAGQHIGELAVLRERPRAATVVADEPGVRGLVIGGQGLRAILRERPEAAMAMLATLAERISTS